MTDWDVILDLLQCTLECQADILTGKDGLSEWFISHVLFARRNPDKYNQFFEHAYYRLTSENVYCITESFHTSTCLIYLGDDRFLVLGPYLTQAPNEDFVNQVSMENRLPVSMMTSLKHFYSKMPLLTHVRVHSIARILQNYLGVRDFRDFLILSVEREDTSRMDDWFSFQEKHVLEYQDMLEQKYQNDLDLCKCLIRGDMEGCLQHQSQKNSSFIRIDPRKNDSFSHLVYDYVFNVLYRILTYAAGVPASHIQELQDKWNRKINDNAKHPNHGEFGSEMLQSYCKLVQKKSLRGHSSYVKKVLAYIDLNLSAHITMETLTHHANVSSGYLSRIFKEEMGETIMDYINRERILRSLPMLQNKTMRISDIGTCVGIADANYFARLFKKYMGETPMEYRIRMEKEGVQIS